MLDPETIIKPIDFGGYGYSGSVDKNGALIALSCYNSAEGIAGLFSAPPLANSERDDRDAVRQYRRQLSDIQGFGPIFDEEPIKRVTRLVAGAIPEIELYFSEGRSATTTIVACKEGVLQRWSFKGIRPSWGGPISVQRAVYPLLPVSLELSEHIHEPTEERATEDVFPNNKVQFSKGRLQIQNTGPDCTAIMRVAKLY